MLHIFEILLTLCSVFLIRPNLTPAPPDRSPGTSPRELQLNSQVWFDINQVNEDKLSRRGYSTAVLYLYFCCGSSGWICYTLCFTEETDQQSWWWRKSSKHLMPDRQWLRETGQLKTMIVKCYTGLVRRQCVLRITTRIGCEINTCFSSGTGHQSFRLVLGEAFRAYE